MKTIKHKLLCPESPTDYMVGGKACCMSLQIRMETINKQK